ncbi:hypothetical protein VTJ04DRAFT_3962 [Mycothermus thermophilus]|uniref:uncharacterized protein n=1 Tax=Humicola insolens TaxID=85995 RepID=UPI003743A99F
MTTLVSAPGGLDLVGLDRDPLSEPLVSRASLQAMPPEVLDLIFEHLVPQVPEIGETRPVAYHQLMAEEPWYEFTRRRRGLRSLCRTSRRLSQLAFPHFYRVVAIWNETALLLFLRTLTDKPQYGLWTRYFSCHITLTELTVIREVRELLPRYLPTFRPARGNGVLITAARHFLQMLGALLPGMVAADGDFDHIPQALVCFILMFLSKVETVMLQVPISDDQPEYQVLCDQIEGLKDLFRNDPDSIPLQHVHTLQLQGDPELMAEIESNDCKCEAHADSTDVWGSQPRKYASLFANCPRLTTLEVSNDDGVWIADQEDENRFDLDGDDDANNNDDDKKPPPPPFLANIKHIYLHNSLAYPDDLYHLILNAPKLETLYMAPRNDELFREAIDDNSPHNAHPEALDNALAHHARHLRSLDVSWQDISGFESVVGPDGRLPSLATMPSLESLCVPMGLLYGRPAAVLETPLVELLPPNLVELVLEDWWFSNVTLLEELPTWGPTERVKYYQSQHHYRVNAIDTLSKFARDVRTRLHKLKKVILICKIPWTWVLEGAVGLEFHFEGVKRQFLQQGVDFSVRGDEV